MQLPILEPAPVVTEHAAVFRDLFENQCQFRHFQHYLTGLMVLPNKSLANIARCTLESADNTNLSRFLSEAPWPEAAVNRRRIGFMLHQTKPHRRGRRESLLALDDTLCEHVGSLFDYVDRHYNHSNGTYPLAHNPVTSLYVSGPVRFPVGLRLYRRYEELTQWEASVATHVPELTIPTEKKARNRLHKQVDPVLLQDPEFRARHEQFQTKIALAIELVEEAIRHKVPCGVVVFDAWYLAEELVQVLTRRRKDWISLLKTNRGLETVSVQLRDANGWTIPLPGPHIAVEELVPLIPAHAYRPVSVGEHTYWCFTLRVRIPTLGKVRIVVSFERESLTGRHVVLVTNRLDWSAAKIISLYSQRWPTELSMRLDTSLNRLDAIDAEQPCPLKTLLHASLMASTLAALLAHTHTVQIRPQQAGAPRTQAPLHPRRLALQLAVSCQSIAQAFELQGAEATQRWDKIAEVLTHRGKDPHWRRRPSVFDQLRGWRRQPIARQKTNGGDASHGHVKVAA